MNDCLSYASLTDAAAAGEPLTAEERLFLRTHPTGCRACGAEASLWENLEQALEDPARLTSTPRRLEQPAASRGRRFQSWLGRRGPSSRRHTLIAAGALLATAAAAAAIAGQSDRPAPRQEPSLAAVPQRVRPAAGSARAAIAPSPSPIAQPESPPFRNAGPAAGDSPTRDRSDGKVPRPAPSTSAAALLAQARGLRADGRYQEASLVYQRLVRELPRSTEAHIALVSLGELQLSQLGNAAGAVRSFDAYLRIGGSLSQEASYGRIRALRQLGRASDARAASEAFIAAYPNSVQAAALRKEHP
jgi:tetratricopeptide (TPR) repeat protein